MRRHLDIWLNDVSLHDVSPLILIQQLNDAAPEVETTFGEWLGRAGQLIINRRALAREITIDYQVRELYDLGARQHIIDQVNAWARPGYLMTNTRPGCRLYVAPTGWSGMQAARDYAEMLSVKFTSAGCPWWEDITPTITTITGASADGALINGGAIDTPVSVQVTPESGTLNDCALTVGDTSITLTDLGATPADPLRISLDMYGLMQITVGANGAMDKRTPQSADELIAAPGANTITLTADTPATAVFSVRGRYR